MNIYTRVRRVEHLDYFLLGPLRSCPNEDHRRAALDDLQGLLISADVITSGSGKRRPVLGLRRTVPVPADVPDDQPINGEFDNIARVPHAQPRDLRLQSTAHRVSG